MAEDHLVTADTDNPVLESWERFADTKRLEAIKASNASWRLDMALRAYRRASLSIAMGVSPIDGISRGEAIEHLNAALVSADYGFDG